jgi:hypothetical protein
MSAPVATPEAGPKVSIVLASDPEDVKPIVVPPVVPKAHHHGAKPKGKGKSAKKAPAEVPAAIAVDAPVPVIEPIEPAPRTRSAAESPHVTFDSDTRGGDTSLEEQQQQPEPELAYVQVDTAVVECGEPGSDIWGKLFVGTLGFGIGLLAHKAYTALRAEQFERDLGEMRGEVRRAVEAAELRVEQEQQARARLMEQLRNMPKRPSTPDPEPAAISTQSSS